MFGKQDNNITCLQHRVFIFSFSHIKNVFNLEDETFAVGNEFIDK